VVEIVWLGHACFRIRGRDATVVMDPCDRPTGYDMGRVRADIVTISSYHPNHSYLAGVRGEPRVLDGPGEYEVKDVTVTGIATHREGHGTENRQRNTVYMAYVDGVAICHLGDLAQSLSSDQIEAIGNVDVLLVPIGGGCTIDGAKAAEVISEIEPRIVVPMHYKTPSTPIPLEGLDRFLKEMGVHTWAARDKLSIKSGEESEGSEVVILDYRGGQGRGGGTDA
jgi:L-ascorbate metabolism protein UlaG (beta-lactamase superfamily)